MPEILVEMKPVRDLVDERIARTIDDAQRRWDAVGPEVGTVLAAARRSTSGGKRLRALFCATAWQAFGGSDVTAGSPVVEAGAALELFQAAALVHDDVMDDSDTRRGAPAAHRWFEQHHHESELAGRRERFGQAGAILLGDLLLMLSSAAMAHAASAVEPSSGARARGVYDHMTGEVTLGQYLDMHAACAPWSPQADLDRALRVIDSKAARYSVEHPLSIGASLAGADAAAVDSCRRIGRPVGVAFQLRDDLLGVFGDPAVTGKPAGDDLREGKRTVLVAIALARADPLEADLIRDLLGDTGLTSAQVDDLRAVVVSTGAVAEVERMIEQRAAEGLRALAQTELEPRGRDRLELLAKAAVERVA